MARSARGKDADNASQGAGDVRYYKRDFWSEENLKYVRPHYRMRKAARIVDKIAGGRECDLLDVGCGPATLMRLLRENIHYYGVDIAIHDPAPNLLEQDFLESSISFGDRRFDIVVAQGVFEYLGTFQAQKLTEIRGLLKDGGRFVVSYVNFGHRNKQVYWPYSNVQSFTEFRDSLARHFSIDKFFPTSYNWKHGEPNRWWVRTPQLYFSPNIPFISPLLAVEYFFICSALRVRLPQKGL